MTLQERLRGCGHFRLSHPHFSGVSDTCDEAADRIDALEKLTVHLTHCNFGEHSGECKYGDEECPALAPAYAWIGQRLDQGQVSRDRIDALERENAALRRHALSALGEIVWSSDARWMTDRAIQAINAIDAAMAQR